jgi:ketosteroid isomerase-like protein
MSVEANLATFAGQAATGRVVSWSSILIYRVRDGKAVQTWAMQDRLALLRQVGAIAEPVAVNWAGGANPLAERSE